MSVRCEEDVSCAETWRKSRWLRAQQVQRPWGKARPKSWGWFPRSGHDLWAREACVQKCPPPPLWSGAYWGSGGGRGPGDLGRGCAGTAIWERAKDGSLSGGCEDKGGTNRFELGWWGLELGFNPTGQSRRDFDLLNLASSLSQGYKRGLFEFLAPLRHHTLTP